MLPPSGRRGGVSGAVHVGWGHLSCDGQPTVCLTPPGNGRSGTARPGSAAVKAKPPQRHQTRPADVNPQGKPLVFLLSDGQLKDEAWLEDVNGLLNAGEVPNLFPADERMAVGGA